MGANQQHITFEWIAPDLAQENPLQYVDHPEEQIDALRYLIHEGPGWAGTAVVNHRLPENGWKPDECGYVYVDGHARASIASEKGEQLPAVIGQWTPDEERTLLATINLTAAMGIIVPEKHLALLNQVTELAHSDTVTEMLESLKAEADMLVAREQNTAFDTSSDIDAEPQLNRAQELAIEWQVERGQLWQLGNHRLLCGDSTKAEDVQRVMNGRLAQLFATDPPYLVDYDGTNHPHKWGANA